MSDLIDRGEWASELLDRLGISNSAALAAIVAWESAENTAATNNPLATTEPGYGGTPLAGNPAGVQDYPTPDDGMDATLATLNNGYYGDILTALASGTAAQIAQAVASSPWGTGRLVVEILPQVQAHFASYSSLPVPGSLTPFGGTPTVPPAPEPPPSPTPPPAPPAETIVSPEAGNTVTLPPGEQYEIQLPRHPVIDRVDVVVGVTLAPSPGGYWALTRAGQVLCYGHAPYLGEPGEGADPMAAISSIGTGYVCVSDTGKLYAFGTAAEYARTAKAQSI